MAPTHIIEQKMRASSQENCFQLGQKCAREFYAVPAQRAFYFERSSTIHSCRSFGRSCDSIEISNRLTVKLILPVTASITISGLLSGSGRWCGTSAI